MNRSTGLIIALVTAALSIVTLLPARTFASGTNHLDCDAGAARGDCPPGAHPRALTAGCNAPLPCKKGVTHRLSTAEMIYLHEKITSDAVLASAAAAWSSALAQAQSPVADAVATEDPHERGAAKRRAPNSRRNMHPTRRPNES